MSYENSIEKVDSYIEKYSLEVEYSEECPGCSHEIIIYQSKYVDDACIRFCPNCHEFQEDIHLPTDNPNVCELCGEIVKFEDDDKDNYIICSDGGCDQKAHKDCAEEAICDKCRIWACQGHENNYIICDDCGLLHTDSCINDFGISSFDGSRNICNTCLNRDNDLIDEIKRPLKRPEHRYILEKINENRNFYIAEAKENFDLTIMLTHLIKDENPFEKLIQILDEKVLKSSETGYYWRTHGTKSVCFADLTTRGLHRHSKNYSAYGLHF
jgi:hypothetical protein